MTTNDHLTALYALVAELDERDQQFAEKLLAITQHLDGRLAALEHRRGWIRRLFHRDRES